MLKYNLQNYSQARYMEHSDAMGTFQHSIKRLFDIVFSLLGLVLLSPLFLFFTIILLFSHFQAGENRIQRKTFHYLQVQNHEY